ISELDERIDPWLNLQKNLRELHELVALKDDSLADEIRQQLTGLAKKYESLKKEMRFRGQYDGRNAVLTIHAGAGGTDAQDWAAMLQRMYVRWAEANGIKVKTLDESAGEEAGTK